MRLLLKQYLTSLKERDELDVVLPDILSEVGFKVISRPSRGTRQYGVDVAAIGPYEKTGTDALFLLSIKSGDLRRADWDSGKQALRPSLVEIIDHYIPKLVPKRYKSLPVVIALCFGGDIHEDIRAVVDSFVDNHTRHGDLEFVEWNGDHIAALISTGLLREHIFPKASKASFRKALAFVDEPTICTSHFDDVLRRMANQPFTKKADRLTAVRQIYLAIWTIYVWCRDVDNLEAAYLCSEQATLWIWDLCHEHITAKSKVAEELRIACEKATLLSRMISSDYIEKHINPYLGFDDGLGALVPSAASVDVNLKLFEQLGRLAIHGLWLMTDKSLLDTNSCQTLRDILESEIQAVSKSIEQMVTENKALMSPIRDDHAIEINMAAILLMTCQRHNYLADWITQTIYASVLAYRRGRYYPCIYRDYAELAAHPQTSEGYREDATAGSILYPVFAVWLAILGKHDTCKLLEEFHRDDMSHCTWQLWLPDSISEEHFYKNTAVHGTTLTNFDLAKGPEKLMEQLKKEVDISSSFSNLSAVRLGNSPLILMACRHYRLPIPPHFWPLDHAN